MKQIDSKNKKKSYDPLAEEFNKGGPFQYYEDEDGISMEDTIDKDIEEAVHSVFPFSSSQEVIYKCPNWTKSLLYQFNTLENVHNVIKKFNISTAEVVPQDEISVINTNNHRNYNRE